MRLILRFQGCRFYRRVFSIQEARKSLQEAGRFLNSGVPREAWNSRKMLRIIERASAKGNQPNSLSTCGAVPVLEFA
jgi:hypothetical protein